MYALPRDTIIKYAVQLSTRTQSRHICEQGYYMYSRCQNYVLNMIMYLLYMICYNSRHIYVHLCTRVILVGTIMEQTATSQTYVTDVLSSTSITVF